MPIIVNPDVMMAKRKMSLNELSEKVGLTLANLSVLKTGKAKAIRFTTLDAICKVLHCRPGIYWNMLKVMWKWELEKVK
ncbi:transcriptional regulator [Dyadobacter frigoris]|uniref:Helix-turn-helix transcriptional regulator n=1 Tax=Dyadobacter frigoris TaxID=2576211 RepID=A0A4U6CVJ0_9BACT|nr:helix-turn-helix transcriptional regulator [Dyadobacter frigoris]TKT88779.1 helix-turn-helix transcriptional regulator [Dyadobacter frigoris]GLU53976.1 transcriptional regulator [Dyadobacter frigoris]